MPQPAPALSTPTSYQLKLGEQHDRPPQVDELPDLVRLVVAMLALAGGPLLGLAIAVSRCRGGR
jgi:hypothetical protein